MILKKEVRSSSKVPIIFAIFGMQNGWLMIKTETLFRSVQ
jgi:hypothetical protein